MIGARFSVFKQFLHGFCVVVCITGLSFFELFILNLPSASFDKRFITNSMKNTNKNMKQAKTIFLSLLLVVIFILPGCSGLHNQSTTAVRESVKLNTDILIGPGECVLKKFQGTSVNNKFYLYWVFESNTNQFFFQVESSVNGKKFKPCWFKHGSVSPDRVSLMLCMTDSVNKNDIVFYRIKAIPENYPIKKKIEQEYKALFTASTIVLTKNKKTKGYMQAESVSDGNLEAMSKEQGLSKGHIH